MWTVCSYKLSVIVICVIIFFFADTVTPADVGLEEENVDDDRGYGVSMLNPFNRAPRWAQPITYMDIHGGDSFTVMPSDKLSISLCSIYILMHF